MGSTFAPGARCDDGNRSSEDDSDEGVPTSPSASPAMRLAAQTAMDLYDKLPPELLEHILALLPHSTLFHCTTLSKRWARIVIPHLWCGPWMMYYVSWMKLLQTISYPSMSSLASPLSGRGGISFGASKSTTKRNRPSHSCAVEDGAIAHQDEPTLAWDNFSDHEDEDPSGLLRLAENQRRESVVVVGWETPDRSASSRTASPALGEDRCGNRSTDNNLNLHAEPDCVASDDTVSSHLFNVQGKCLCPYLANVDMPPSLGASTSSSTPLSISTLSEATCSSGVSTSTSRATPHATQASPPSPPGILPQLSPSSSRPFLRPSYGPLIRTLDFSELYYILSDKFLTHLFPHTPQLTTLIVNAPKQFSDESLYVLATCCRALQRCDLLGCDQISDQGVHFLLDQQHHHQGSKSPSESRSKGEGSTLRELSLANRAPITDGVLQHLAYVSFASKLERLSLANAVFVTGLEPGLGTVFRCCTGLKTLNVSHCQGVTDQLLKTLGCVDTLQRLSVAHCYEVTDHGICAVAKACGQLEELDISACGAVSDKSLYALGTWCRGFRRLVMDERYGGRVTEQGLEKFSWGVEMLQGWRRYRQTTGRPSRRIF